MPDLNLGHIAFAQTARRDPQNRRRKGRRSQPLRPLAPGGAGPAIAPKFELVTGQASRPLQERSSLPTTIFSVIAHTGFFGVAFLVFSVTAGIALPTPRQASNLIAVVVAAPPPPPAPAAPAAPEVAAAPSAPPMPPAPPLERPLQDLAAALPGFAGLAPEELPPTYGLGALGNGPALSTGFGGVDGGVGWGNGTAPGAAPQEPVKVATAEAPTLMHRVEPVYPKDAAASRIQGTVVVEATVDERGQVQDVRILRSIADLDAAAIAAVKQWRYEPLTVDGHPASFIITINVSFHLR